MRVNMDSSIVTDPRFKLVAADLKCSWREVVGSCFLLWLACYERRSKCLRLDEADVAAEQPGFAEALIKRGLATRIDDETMHVHGVEKRIEFLAKQTEKGKRGGKKSAKAKKSAQANAQAPAQADAQPPATGSAQAYSPALDLDHDQAPAQDPAHPQRVVSVPLNDKPPEYEPDARVGQVVEFYRQKYPNRLAQAQKPETRALIRQRLGEGYTVEQLCRAIEGNGASDFYREKALNELRRIVESPEAVDRFIALAAPKAAKRTGIYSRDLTKEPL